jgi:hypothetical protein
MKNLLAAANAWRRQPSTVLGLSALAGALAAALKHDYPTAISLVSAGIVGIALPDNAGAKAPIEQLISDGVQAAAAKHFAEEMPKLIADAAGVARAMLPAPAQVAPAVTVGPAPLAGVPVTTSDVVATTVLAQAASPTPTA